MIMKNKNLLVSSKIGALPFRIRVKSMDLKGSILRCNSCVISLTPIKKKASVFGMRCPKCKKTVLFVE